MLATGGVSEPASAGVSGLATGGVCELASGGVSGLAGGGTSGPASGGAAATVPRRNIVLWRLRNLVKGVRAAMAARPQLPYPRTKDALAALEVAMQSECRIRRVVRKKKDGARTRRKPLTPESMRASHREVRRQKERIAELEARLHSETTPKGRGGMITAEWLTRCALAAPTVSLRSLARSFQDIQGKDSTVVSRPTIKAARGALVETLKVETGAHARRVVAADRARAGANNETFHALVLVHAQDAADLRLRSREDFASGLPTRSRASNVLGEVVTLFVKDHRISWPIELVALGCKNAGTVVSAL